MRTLKYAILGLLYRGPLTGYDIAREFDRALGYFWHAGHSQIYPEMRRLVNEGLVRYEVVIQGERMEKKLYTLTDAGREAFMEWMVVDEPPDRTTKDVFKLRVYMSDVLTDEELLEHFAFQREQRQRKLDDFSALMEMWYGDADPAGLDPVRRGDYMTLMGGILRERAYVSWIDSCMAILGG